MFKGVHFLLTYKCDLECDHCFVWGSPTSKGAFTLKQIKNILTEAKKMATVDYVSIEGGEPFLYYPIMITAANQAAEMGCKVEILTNSYWATSPEDAVEWLLPLSKITDLELSLSSDLYHREEWEAEEVRNAVKAASSLGIKRGVIAVKHPEAQTQSPSEIEETKVSLWELMCRGRAVTKLAHKITCKKPWNEFTKCPYEDFANQERVHVDPFGYVHVCQGISIGNAWKKPLSQIAVEFDPYKNPILEPLINGGPAQLVRKFSIPHEKSYADACHLCYEARCVLRTAFPEILAPDQMYGEGIGELTIEQT